jgi:hypothetical protein
MGKFLPSTDFLLRIFKCILRFRSYILVVVDLKPIYCLQMSEPEFQTPDFGVLVCLLRSIGFELHCIENLPSGSPDQRSEQEPRTSYSVNITCPQSGLCAVLRSRSSTEASAISNIDSTTREVRLCGLHLLKCTKE